MTGGGRAGGGMSPDVMECAKTILAGDSNRIARNDVSEAERKQVSQCVSERVRRPPPESQKRPPDDMSMPEGGIKPGELPSRDQFMPGDHMMPSPEKTGIDPAYNEQYPRQGNATPSGEFDAQFRQQYEQQYRQEYNRQYQFGNWVRQADTTLLFNYLCQA